MIDCSICIPTFKRPVTLNMLLTNILGLGDSRVKEVLIGVTDNLEDSFDDNTFAILRAFEIAEIDVKVRNNSKGLLYSKQWFKDTASSEILLLIDDDVFIDRSYLNLLMRFRDKDVCGVSGSIQTPYLTEYYADYSFEKINNPDDALCNIVSFDEDIVKVKKKHQVYMMKEPKIYECECLIGSALFVRKNEMIIDINYQFGACNYEEIDFTYNMFKQGKRLIFDSSCVAFHNRQNKGGMREYIKEKRANSDYFKEKWNTTQTM